MMLKYRKFKTLHDVNHIVSGLSGSAGVGSPTLPLGTWCKFSRSSRLSRGIDDNQDPPQSLSSGS